MFSSSSSLSLTRRLLGQYLMFALAGLFACVVVTMFLAVRNDLLESSQCVLILPLLFVGFGAFALYRVVRVNASIDRQLNQVSAAGCPLSAPLTPVTDNAPQARGWNAIVRRLQEQADQQALESQLNTAFAGLTQQSWQPIFDGLPEGVVAVDSAGRVARANRPALAVLGAAVESDLIGQSMIDCLAGRLPEKSLSTLAAFQATSGAVFRELNFTSESMTGVWRVSRVPIIGAQDSVYSAIWTIRDVTQSKLADQMRNQFVSTAAHELRTPLANIKAYAETLASQTEISVEQQHEFYNIINAEATRLARFVDELLDVSQLESGAVAFDRVDTDIERLLNEVVAHVAPQIQQKKLRFQTNYPPKFPKLLSDKDKLSAALLNLVSNALKYTPEGGSIKLDVSADAMQIHFKIEDTGIGISPEDLSKLCEKFYRSDDARVRAINGSGLGLAFTREVAQRHGGSLAISSVLDKGSTFTLSLPLNG